MSVLNLSGDEAPECPLCMELLELDDISFYPCTCGYQVRYRYLLVLYSGPSYFFFFWGGANSGPLAGSGLLYFSINFEINLKLSSNSMFKRINLAQLFCEPFFLSLL